MITLTKKKHYSAKAALCLLSLLNAFGLVLRQTAKEIQGQAIYLDKLSLFQALCQWRIEKAGGRRVGSGREKGEVRRACKHCFKNLIPVYQLLVYPLIGYFWQFISTPCLFVWSEVMLNMVSMIHARFRGVQIYSSVQNGVKNASDQNGPSIDVFAIIPSDFRRSLHFFRWFLLFVMCKFAYAYFHCKVCSKFSNIRSWGANLSLKYSVNIVLTCILNCVLLQVHGYHIYLCGLHNFRHHETKTRNLSVFESHVWGCCKVTRKL